MKVLRFKSTNNTAYSDSPITATVLSKPDNTRDNINSLYNETQLDNNVDALTETQPCPQQPTYMQDYLKSNLDKKMDVEFLIGTDNLVSKTGILNEVGTDYIVLIVEPDKNELLCDFYAIKFIHLLS